MKKFQDVINEAKPSLVLFIREGEQHDPDLVKAEEELKAKYGDRVNFLRVDSSYDHIVNKLHNLTTYPTWILFKEGQELMRETGKKTAAHLSEMVERGF